MIRGFSWRICRFQGETQRTGVTEYDMLETCLLSPILKRTTLNQLTSIADEDQTIQICYFLVELRQLLLPVQLSGPS